MYLLFNTIRINKNKGSLSNCSSRGEPRQTCWVKKPNTASWRAFWSRKGQWLKFRGNLSKHGVELLKVGQKQKCIAIGVSRTIVFREKIWSEKYRVILVTEILNFLIRHKVNFYAPTSIDLKYIKQKLMETQVKINSKLYWKIFTHPCRENEILVQEECLLLSKSFILSL